MDRNADLYISTAIQMVLPHILPFLPTAELKTARSVCRTWNFPCLTKLYSRDVLNVSKMDYFLSSNGLSSSSYFDLSLCRNLKLYSWIPSVGENKPALAKFENTYKVRRVHLYGMEQVAAISNFDMHESLSNLIEVRIEINDEDSVQTTHSNCTAFSNIRKLVLFIPEDNVGPQIQAPLQNLLKTARNLFELKCTIPIDLSTQDKLQKLKLAININDNSQLLDGVEGMLRSVQKTLRSLSLDLKKSLTVQLPLMPRLTDLRLIGHYDYHGRSDDQFCTDIFEAAPSLKSLSVKAGQTYMDPSFQIYLSRKPQQLEFVNILTWHHHWNMNLAQLQIMLDNLPSLKAVRILWNVRHNWVASPEEWLEAILNLRFPRLIFSVDEDMSISILLKHLIQICVDVEPGESPAGFLEIENGDLKNIRNFTDSENGIRKFVRVAKTLCKRWEKIRFKRFKIYLTRLLEEIKENSFPTEIMT